MVNESLFIISVILGILFVSFVYRGGLTWLLTSIVVNLILGIIFGAKLFSVFGLVLNIGNVFYACVFFATYFVLEKHDKHEAIKTIWLGMSFILFFIIMSQLAVRFVGLPVSDISNSAILTLFTFSTRVTLASILAFVFAQYLNIRLYEYIKILTKGRYLWLRINGSNIAAQLLDSMLFFTIAFPSLPGPLLIQAIFVGWFIKSLVVLVGTPLFYLSSYLDKKHA